MASLNGFNANDVEPTTAFEPLPAGKYLAAITASEMKATKAGDGSYLELEFTVIEGDCKDRKVWDRLCINHRNEMAQKIARGNLSAICRAVGVMQPRDSVDLHNLPLVITVKCRKREDNGEITNEVKLHAIAPDLWNKIGVYSAGLGSRDTDHPIIVAGIQSVYKRAAELDAFDLILVDEVARQPELPRV